MLMVADGGEHTTWALALALQSPWHSAAPEHESVPVHDGWVIATLQPPWHWPLQVADPGVYEQVPLHVPLHVAPVDTLHLPVHFPLQVPPENVPEQAAWHAPLAWASHVPAQVPLQVAPLTLLPLHVPVQLPPQLPEKFAVHPALQLPLQLGASQVPVHSPLQLTAAVAVHSPLHVPLHAKLGSCDVALRAARARLHQRRHRRPCSSPIRRSSRLPRTMPGSSPERWR